MYKEINLARLHTGRREQPLKSHINLCVCTVQAPCGAGRNRVLSGEAKDLDLETQFTEFPCSELGMGCRKARWTGGEREGKEGQERPMNRGKNKGRERKEGGGRHLGSILPGDHIHTPLLTQEEDAVHQQCDTRPSAWRVQPGSESMVPLPLPPPLYSFTQRPVPTRVLSTQMLTATEGARPEAFEGSSHLLP